MTKMVLTKTICSMSRQHKRDRSLVAQERSNKICTNATLLFSLLVLTSFALLCIGGHTLFLYFLFLFLSFFSTFFLCLEAFFFSMSHFSSFVYLSHRACFGALLNTTHTHPLTVVTLVQCFATLGKPLSMG